jgi:hypothetical protein
VATFCHNVARDLPITVSDPAVELELLYIDDLVAAMLDALEGRVCRCRYDGLTPVADEKGPFCYVPNTHRATLGRIVELLEIFRQQPETLVMPRIPAGSFENPLIEIPVYRAALQTAAAAASILGVSVKPLEQFSAVPGRMQLLEEGGVFVLDNSNSGTTVENTLEAAAYLQQVAGKHVILVVGEGAHAVCEGLTGRDSIPEKDFAAVIPAEGRVFDELKNEAVSLAKERDASVLLAVKTWR